jgi:large subunit ribosomal protein L4
VQRRRDDGTVIDTVGLDPEFFGLAPNTAVLHQVITAQRAAARSGTQSTRTRAEVRGGGAKPFRQKGTGRARQGSIRSPQWTGGGVALGPKPRSYRQRTPKKMIRLALCSALSDQARSGRVALVDEWSFPVPKTKDAVAAVGALGLTGKVLVVLGPDDGIPDRSFANLPHVQTVQLAELNAYDVVKSDWVVFTDATLPGETSPMADAPEPAPRARTARGPGGTAGTRPSPRAATAKKAKAAQDAAPPEVEAEVAEGASEADQVVTLEEKDATASDEGTADPTDLDEGGAS